MRNGLRGLVAIDGKLAVVQNAGGREGGKGDILLARPMHRIGHHFARVPLRHARPEQLRQPAGAGDGGDVGINAGADTVAQDEFGIVERALA